MFFLSIEIKIIAAVLSWVSLPHMGKGLSRLDSISDIV